MHQIEKYIAVVAQLAERYLGKIEGVGSNPIFSTKQLASSIEGNALLANV